MNIQTNENGRNAHECEVHTSTGRNPILLVQEVIIDLVIRDTTGMQETEALAWATRPTYYDKKDQLMFEPDMANITALPCRRVCRQLIAFYEMQHLTPLRC